MKRILAFACVLAMVLSIVPAAAFAAQQDLQAIIDAGAEEIIVLEADASNVTVNRDTTIDLNGHNIDGVTVLAGTLYCLDSQTADYTVADGVYGHVTGVTGAVKAAEGYLQVGDSFHAVNLDIYAMTLRAADVGVYYKSNFAADEIVAAQVESFGVALSVVTAPNAENLDSYCGYSVFEGFEAGEGANAVGTSTLLKGIMKAANGDNKNAKNAAMPIYGRAYIKTAEGYIFGETVKRSLQEQVEAIDKVWNKLTDAQKAPVLGMLEAYTSVMEGWNIPNIKGGEAGEGAGEITVPVEVTTENGVVTEAVTVEQGAVSITVPAGVKLSEGAEKLTLTVTPKETSDTGIELEKNEVLMPMDVHVEGLAADNAQPVTIYLGKVMAENLNMGNYAVYHVENGKANEMTLIGVNEEFTAHNQYKYTLDGELTLYMATFSEVAIRSTIKNTWQGGYDYSWYNTTDTTLYIRNADQLAAFGAIVGDMAFKEVETQEYDYTFIDIEPIVEEDSFAGKTVVLLADIDLGDKDDESGYLFYPIGYGNSNMSYEKPSDGTVAGAYMQAFEGTFDGNGNTISNFYQNTWQMWGDYDGNNYDSAMGLFAYVNGGTVKNLTVSNFSSDGEYAPTGVIAAYAINSTFENIAITNCNPRVYNTGNGGIVGIGGSSTDSEEYALTFNNITIDNTNKITALWGSWDVACGGLVGMFYGKGHVNMTNCHVAAQIDVYNDVCGNYQYYWYRYSGMLIGTNKNMTTDANGYTVPETDKFHATDCTVHFGTWNDYYYCELVENSLASYTHDHQFSRLTLIDSVSEIQDGEGNWNKTGNFMIVSENKCYHVRKDENGFYLHSHDDYNRDGKEDKETVNGEEIYVENNRCVYLPFNQLFTGYGWGVKHIPLGEFEGVTILPRETADSVIKFEGLVENDAQYASGATLTIGDLFEAADQTEVAIVRENVQVSVSPADENSTVSGIYTANKKDWTKGYLALVGSGAAKITITDYNYCKETVLTVTVNAPVVGDTNEAYVKVTEEPADWSGDYLIVCEAENVALNGGLTTLDVTKNTISVTIADGKIAANDATNAAKFTIEKIESDGTYTIRSASGKYIGNPNADNDLDESDKEQYTNTITLSNGLLKVKGSGGRSLQYNKATTEGSQRFRYYTDENHQAIALYKLTTNTNAGASCDHEGATATITSADCTHTGTVVIHCAVCGDVSSNLAAWGHNYDDGVVTTEPTCTETGEKTYTCYACGNTKTEETEAAGHKDKNEDDKCDICEEILATTGWVLVTDASTLAIDDKIVIVTANAHNAKYYAMSTTQNNNNRAQTEITKVDNTVVFAHADGVQIIVLEEGVVDGTFAFNTGAGYLYAASSGSNHLKTKTVLDANGSWKLTIASAGVATIKAQGEYTRNWLRYNSTNNPPIFSAYGSGQADIAIYKWYGDGEPEAYEHTYETVVTNPTCTEGGYTTYTCACGDTYITDETEPTGHSDGDGNNFCDACGTNISSGGETTEKTVTMNIYANQGDLSGKVITWTSGDVTFQNAQASSTTSIFTSDTTYYRLYKSSTATVSVASGKITKVVFTCTSSSYATVLQTSLNNAGYTATVSGSVVAVELVEAESELTFTLSAQSRISEIEVTYTES